MKLPVATYEQYSGKTLPKQTRTLLSCARNIERMDSEKEYGKPACVTTYADIADWADGHGWDSFSDHMHGNIPILRTVGWTDNVGGAVRQLMYFSMSKSGYTWTPADGILRNGVLGARKWNKLYPDFPVIAVEFREPYFSPHPFFVGDIVRVCFVGFMVECFRQVLTLVPELHNPDPRAPAGFCGRNDKVAPINPDNSGRYGKVVPWIYVQRIDLFGLDKPRNKPRKKKVRPNEAGT